MKKVKKFVIGTLAALMLFGGLSIPSNAMEQNNSDESDIIIVEVVVNQLGPEYIENILLDDGTRIGDHDFIVIEERGRIGARSQPQVIHIHNAIRALNSNFDFVGWITRGGVVSISLDPVQAVRSNNRARANTAWDALRNPLAGISTDSRWRNESALRAQYFCHWEIARNKSRWNLEPHRTATSAIVNAAFLCNP